MKYITLLSLFVAGTNAWVLSYYNEQGCRGEELGKQTIDNKAGSCVEVTTDNVSSVEVIATGNTKTTLNFYTGTGCSSDNLITVSFGAGCTTFSLDGLGSVKAV